jgi:RNA polymerase sigma-70 factor, ECF subfamily
MKTHDLKEHYIPAKQVHLPGRSFRTKPLKDGIMKTEFDSAAPLTDHQLVALAKQGDRDAFSELIQRHRRRCANLATSILRHRGEAEEETQNACWKAFQHIDQFNGDAQFSTWLMRIVENQCLMLIRQRRLAQFVHLDDLDPERGKGPTQLPAPDADPEGELGRQEVLRVLQAEIHSIPPLLRKVLVMRDVEEMPVSDLAASLGITVAAVKSRLLRARAELRQRMLRHCTRTGPWSLMTTVAAPAGRVFHQQVAKRPSM